MCSPYNFKALYKKVHYSSIDLNKLPDDLSSLEVSPEEMDEIKMARQNFRDAKRKWEKKGPEYYMP